MISNIEAIQTAKKYLEDVFDGSGERITNLGLEEIRLSDNERVWEITLGFSRPWQRHGTSVADVIQGVRHRPPERTYKIVVLEADTGKFVSMDNREPVRA